MGVHVDDPHARRNVLRDTSARAHRQRRACSGQKSPAREGSHGA
jgi:hypothetical protein